MRRRRFGAGLVCVLAMLLLATTLVAADKTWDTSANDFWNSATWVNGPPNPAGGDQAFFGNVGTGFVNTLDQDYLLEGLYYQQAGGTHTTDLGGNTLTIRAGRPVYVGRNFGPADVVIQNGILDVQNADFRIGEVEPTAPAGGSLTVTSTFLSNQLPVFRIGRNETGGGSVSGTLDLTQATGLLSIWNNSRMDVGLGRDATGLVELGPDMDVVIGSDPAYVNTQIGQTNGRNELDTLTTSGTVLGNGADWASHHSYLMIGINEQNTGAATGLVDLRGSAGTLDTYGWETRVGVGRQASGQLLVGDAMTVSLGQSDPQKTAVWIGNTFSRNGVGQTSTGEVQAGQSTFNIHANFLGAGINEQNSGSAQGTLNMADVAGGTVQTYGWETRAGFGKNASGTIDFGSQTVSIGQSDTQRASLRIAETQSRNATGETTTGIVRANNGTVFDGHIHQFTVGQNLGYEGVADGLLDLSSASGGTLNVYFDSRIGWGGRTQGEVILSPAMAASFGTPDTKIYFRLGDSESRNDVGEHTTGLLDANGASVSLDLTTARIGMNNREQGSVSGTMDLSTATGGQLHTTGGNVLLGFGGRAVGVVELSSAMTARIGRDDAWTWLRVGDAEGRNLGSDLTEGRFLANGAAVTTHLNNCYIGFNNRDVEGQAVGVVDLSTATGGSFNTYGHQTLIGFGGDASGQLLLGASDDVFGRSDNRSWLRIGETENRIGTMTSGVMTKVGGTFEAHLHHLWVGHNPRSDGNAVSGLLDLSATTLVAMDYSGEMIIGRGYDADGEIILPAGTVEAMNRTYIGDSDAGGQAGGSGRLELQKTLLVVADTTEIDINESGELDALISGDSSGLSVEQSATWGLEIRSLATAGGGIELTFDDPSFTPDAVTPYWGLRWKGDHVATVEGWLLAGGYTGTGEIVASTIGVLDINDLTVGMYTDGGEDYTFVGFTVPEPATMVLLTMGGVAMLSRRRR